MRLLLKVYKPVKLGENMSDEKKIKPAPGNRTGIVERRDGHSNFSRKSGNNAITDRVAAPPPPPGENKRQD